MDISGRFTAHPRSVGETYGQHFRVASHFAAELAKASIACAVHAVYPSACTTRGSDTVKALYAEMTTGARGEASPSPTAAPLPVTGSGEYAVGSS